MPKLRILSGHDVVAILEGLGFSVVAQKGSHVKLRRTVEGGTKQSLTIPLHAEMDKWTLKAIYTQASRYIPETELREHFYTK
ncbi:MAG: type II toxin-antitoxin system HicA family toxin [Candidatus Sungbacteria bacterium]|uniref:Type II toxin-antitoxin system HicA family toxin n=1 Tax=Candidatus Sungiibacteriota bacterium TaxID=2750080 RepID=A0A9D6LRU9_9BACT|nr:type II toxin-antitoxin system HicA family toxin [Candidatus Sungbacteria bacterium]